MKFNRKILEWFGANQRALPWRKTKDPYKIWLSEIILQQTRIEQGEPYYQSFTKTFETIEDLAKASEDEVLKLWQGLGYYSRARNLHRTAQIIFNTKNGDFPESSKELQKLPGIGPYTSAAIASICFDEKIAAVDGNVQRVISRYFGIKLPVDKPEGVKAISAIANDNVPTDKPGDFNQALMDFGSMLCSKNNPDCSHCPLMESCYAFRNKLTANLPVKTKKPPLKTRHFHYFVLIENGFILLEKRKGKDIWQGLYQFPIREVNENSVGLTDSDSKPILLKKYERILSHQRLHITFWGGIPDSFYLKNSYIRVALDKLRDYPVPRVVEMFIQSREFLTLLDKSGFNA